MSSELSPSISEAVDLLLQNVKRVLYDILDMHIRQNVASSLTTDRK